MTSRLLVEARIDPNWQNNTKGIYADYSDGRLSPRFYCKCPNCSYVHGDHKKFEEAFYGRLCPLCKRKTGLDRQKDVMKSRLPEKRKRPTNTFSLRVESIVSDLLGR